MSDETQTNIPEVVAEVTEAFVAYEKALISHDLDVLALSFGDREDLVRFGIRDRQKGPEELAAWRVSHGALPSNRTLIETVVTTFGHHFASVSTMFYYPGRPFLGRQSQTWIKSENGWKIVHAHISEIPDSTVRS